MKRTLLIVMLLPTLIFGQKIATTFKNAADKGISIEKLDETYQSALHSDSTKAAFMGQEKEFYNSYVSLLTDLQQFLKKNNFKWGKATTKCFNRIYLNKDGGIDYFLFNFKPGEIGTEKEKEFETLLGQFIQTYKFPLTNKNNFAQCSPVTYTEK
jgi:hypothetical protein